MSGTRKMDIAQFATEIEKMGDEELFALMLEMEKSGERKPDRSGDDLEARMALLETEIEQRFPGQLLAPFKRWKDARLI